MNLTTEPKANPMLSARSMPKRLFPILSWIGEYSLIWKFPVQSPPQWIHGRHQNLNTFLLFAAHLCTPETLFILQSCLGSVPQKALIVKLYIDSTAGKSHLAVFWGLALQECPPVSWARVGIQHRHQIFWINNLIGGERKKKNSGKEFSHSKTYKEWGKKANHLIVSSKGGQALPKENLHPCS